MKNTIQLYTDESRKVKGYPITSPDRVLYGDGKSIKDKLKKTVKFDVVGEGETTPPIGGEIDKIKEQVESIENNKIDKNTNIVLFMPISTTETAAGDCSVIISKTGKVVMIDTGATPSYSLIKENLKKYGVKKIDYLIISHYHADHCQNLESLKNDFNMTNTQYYLQKHTTKFNYSDNYVTGLIGNNTKIYPNSNDILKVDDITFTFFNCSQEDIDYYDANSTNYNDYSLCCYCECGDTTILFTGDINVKAQARINEKGLFKKVDVLKVEHHAYDSVVNHDYIRIVNPTYAVVSESEVAFTNKISIMSETLTLLNSLGAKVLCAGKELIKYSFNEHYNQMTHEYHLSGALNNEYGYFVIYIDKNYIGTSNGTFHRPFRSMVEAIAEAGKMSNLNVEIRLKNNSVDYVSNEQIRIVNSSNTIKLPKISVKSLSVINSNIIVNELTLTGQINRALIVESSTVEFKKITLTGNMTGVSSDYDGRGIAIYKSKFYGKDLVCSNKKICLCVYNLSEVSIDSISGVNNKYALICDTGSDITIKTSTLEYDQKFKDISVFVDVKGAISKFTNRKLTDNEDLNNIKDPGKYISSKGSTTITLKNRPNGIGYACVLEVEELTGDGSIKQTITSRHLNNVNASTNKTGIWIRTYNPTDGWSNWFEIVLK